MELANVDLNLLVPLQALLEEKSVSRAAERIHMSQPALSQSLSRLRRHFNDDLLVRSGNSYVLSPLAVHLSSEIQAASASVTRVFGSQSDFDPASSQREFRIICSDYAASVFGAALSRRIAKYAPSVQLVFEQMEDSVVDNAPESLRDVDGLIVPHGYIKGAAHQELFLDRWVCIADASRHEGDTLSEEALGRLPWVVTFNGRTAITLAIRELHTIGIYPHIQVVSRNFLTLADLVVDTNRIAFAPEALARRLAETRPVVVLDPPIEVPDLRNAFWWNAAFDDDPGHVWLRAQMNQVTVPGMRR
ncbi:MAG: LysR family transcriptional regulator [Leifsonia flava]